MAEHPVYDCEEYIDITIPETLLMKCVAEGKPMVMTKDTRGADVDQYLLGSVYGREQVLCANCLTHLKHHALVVGTADYEENCVWYQYYCRGCCRTLERNDG